MGKEFYSRRFETRVWHLYILWAATAFLLIAWVVMTGVEDASHLFFRINNMVGFSYLSLVCLMVRCQYFRSWFEHNLDIVVLPCLLHHLAYQTLTDFRAVRVMSFFLDTTEEAVQSEADDPEALALLFNIMMIIGASQMRLFSPRTLSLILIFAQAWWVALVLLLGSQANSLILLKAGLMYSACCIIAFVGGVRAERELRLELDQRYSERSDVLQTLRQASVPIALIRMTSSDSAFSRAHPPTAGNRPMEAPAVTKSISVGSTGSKDSHSSTGSTASSADAATLVIDLWNEAFAELHLSQ